MSASFFVEELILVIAALSIGTPIGTTGIVPVIHCLWVSPPLRLAVVRFQASSRFLRATAVRMNLPTATRAACSSGTCLVTCGVCAGWLLNVSFEFGVFPKKTIMNTITPTASSPPANQGRYLLNRREDNADWTTFTAIRIVDDECA